MNMENGELIEEKAKIFKALGHPTRLFMVEELGKGERCVCELVALVGCDFSTVSKHLAVLKQACIVEVEKRGLMVFYRLKVPCVLNFMGCIDAVVKSKAAAHLKLLA
jgi:ArsR family transcriptional regulator